METTILVKEGKVRSAKFSAKHDPKVIMYRLKSLQNLAHMNFVDAAIQHQLIDENLAEWLTEANLKYGQRGSLYDLVKKVAWNWLILDNVVKAALHEQWIAKGLPESLWLKIENKYYEFSSFHTSYGSKNIMVAYETDVFPYPLESLEDQKQNFMLLFEVLGIDPYSYVQGYWRQKTVKYSSVSFMYYWEKRMTDKNAVLSTVIETVQPLIFEKSVQVFAHITDPYPSPFDKFPVLEAKYSTLLTAFIVAGNPPSPHTSSATNVQTGESESKNVAASFTTSVDVIVGLYENYHPACDWNNNFWDNYWEAQTFTVGATPHTIIKVKLMLKRTGTDTTPTLNVKIETVDVNGKPTGTILTSGSISFADIPTDYALVQIPVAEYALNANTKYAIVFYGSNPSQPPVLNIDGKAAGEYADGQFLQSSDAGLSWTGYNFDLYFEVWGNPL
jgi:hypothetical protein